MKWEYLTATMGYKLKSGTVVDYGRLEITCAGEDEEKHGMLMEDVLNELNGDSWEVISANLTGLPRYAAFLLRREIEPAT